MKILLFVSEGDIQATAKTKGGERLSDEQLADIESRIKFGGPLWDKILECILSEVQQPTVK